MSRILCNDECSPFTEAFVFYNSISRPVLGASVTSQKIEGMAAKANAQIPNIKALITAVRKAADDFGIHPSLPRRKPNRWLWLLRHRNHGRGAISRPASVNGSRMLAY